MTISIPEEAFDYTECDEIADALRFKYDLTRPFATFDEAMRFVRRALPDESMTVIDNVAEAMTAKIKPTPKAPIDGWGEW